MPYKSDRGADVQDRYNTINMPAGRTIADVSGICF